MSAGLPGLGLGGLFFIFSALLAPVRQLLRTSRGRGRSGDWAMIGRQFAQAMVMVAAIDLALRLAYLAIDAAGLGNTPSAVSATVIPLALIGITSALLVGVLATAKVADITIRLRAAELPLVPDVLSRPAPLRTLALGGVVALAWLALLVAGASELSPLERPRREEATTKQQAEDAQAPQAHSARSQGQPKIEAISGRAPASPRPSETGQLAAEPNHEPHSSEPGTVVQPAVSSPAPLGVAPTHQEQTPSAPPSVGAPSTPSASPESEAAEVVKPHPSGPPPAAGPPEGSSAPEHAGPPEPSELPPSSKEK
ncbi:MAG: hypothetical protein ACLGG5_08520 [Thermoleophilia bacterium]